MIMKIAFNRLSRNAPRCAALLIGVIIFALTLNFSIFGQQINPTPDKSAAQKRPRIGLVLSGGGARGFAHVGVIKVLEENHIPVDYIAGASMGALVGALYATGRTPAEMGNLIETLDWDELLRGKPTFDNLNYRRKEDRRNLPGAITLGGKKTNLGFFAQPLETDQ
jgi:hypothetical protein